MTYFVLNGLDRQPDRRAQQRRVDAEGERQEELSAQGIGRRRDEAAARRASVERVRARLQRPP